MSEETSRGGDGALDRAIDRAVRDLMSAEPPAGLRRRVLARLEAPPRRAAVLPRLAFATAAIGIAVLAAVLFLRQPPAPGVDERAMVVPVPGNPPVTATARPSAEPREVPRAPRVVPRQPDRTPIDMPRITNVFGERGNRVAATAAPAETVVYTPPAVPGGGEAIAPPGGISVSAIHIEPLHVAPIRVEPLRARQ